MVILNMHCDKTLLNEKEFSYKIEYKEMEKKNGAKTGFDSRWD